MVWNDAIWEVLAELMERLHSGLLGLVTELFHLASKTAPMLTILS
jgi:hypothetical protein